MLQRDYIMRLIQLFFEALAKFIRSKEGKEPELVRLELDDLYKTFLKQPRGYFNDLSIEDIINSFDEEELFKIEIVAELMYQDALIGSINEGLLTKSLALMKHIDLFSDTFSLNRQRKIGEIESLLHN